jgi:HSP20 family protein
MNSLVRFDPFDELWNSPFRLSGALRPGQFASRAFVPAMSITDTGDNYQLGIDMPGFDNDDIDITIEHHLLTISGQRQHEHNGDSGYRLRSYGRFERRLALPDGVDAESIVAELDKGVLTVIIPKPAPATKKRIAVTTPNALDAGEYGKDAATDQSLDTEAAETEAALSAA